MEPRLYADLAAWWPVLSTPADYAEEARVYRHALEACTARPLAEVLELGSGGGNNASHLKQWYRLTLVDRAPGMLAVSRALNPECEHVEGDMRNVRLGGDFDAVFVHDAVSYLTTEEDLRAAMATAHAHLRSGGVAVFCPDHVKETFRPSTTHGGHDRGERSLRYLEWSHDPDPDDTTYLTSFAYLLKEGDGPVRCEQDEHVMGLFPRDTWLRLMADVGFVPEILPFPHSSFAEDEEHELYVGRMRT